MVITAPACLAAAAAVPGLDGHMVAGREGGDRGPDGGDGAGGLVAHYYWGRGGDLAVADAAFRPEMYLWGLDWDGMRGKGRGRGIYVTATDADEGGPDEDIVGVLQLWNWAVFEAGVACAVEEACGILRKNVTKGAVEAR